MLASVRKGIEGAKTQSLQRVKSLLYQLKHERKGDGGEAEVYGSRPHAALCSRSPFSLPPIPLRALLMALLIHLHFLLLPTHLIDNLL